MDLKKHNINADIIRVIAGLAVVFIHITDSYIIYPPFYGIRDASWVLLNILNVASRVSVPLFIMLSGYLLLNPSKHTNFRSFYQRRFIRVGIPLVFWTVIYFIWISITGKETLNIKTIITDILQVRIGHLYFLVIILELYFLTPLFIHFFKNKGKTFHFLLLFISFLFAISLNLINSYSLNQIFDMSQNFFTIFIPFLAYYFGGYYFKNIKLSSGKTFLLGVVFVVITFFTAFSNNSVLVNTYQLHFDSPNVALMSFIIFILFINNNYIKNIFNKKFLSISVKNISTAIFGIYLVHEFLIDIMDKYYSWGPSSVGSPMWLFVVFKFIIVYVVSYIFVSVGKKIPYVKTLFG